MFFEQEHEREKRKLEDTIDDLQHKVTEISSRASKAEASVRKLTADYNDLKMSRDCSERAGLLYFFVLVFLVFFFMSIFH